MEYLLIITYFISLVVSAFGDYILTSIMKIDIDKYDFVYNLLYILTSVTNSNIFYFGPLFFYYIIYVNPIGLKDLDNWMAYLRNTLGLPILTIVFLVLANFVAFSISYLVIFLPRNLFQSVRNEYGDDENYVVKSLLPFIILITINFGIFLISELIYSGITIDKFAFMLLLGRILLFMIIMVGITYSASLIMRTFGFEEMDIIKSLLLFLILINIVYLILPITILYKIVAIPLSLSSILLAYVISPLLLRKNLGKAYLSYIIILIVSIISNLLLITIVGGILE
ncbi:hypothetical protein [Sulfurisphaera ohwakuensis]|uniref:Uncharacterized protein n=1 Tax=Sulfurisphaera ohwakuensis TaxID=69656 RepID=A0A650CFQ8_SULOH|nr:hypothetical protein [Sulfurisphaera ohwakuensis]MBB5255283.1 hypothetical protein [Sulfurisphaera ohwakuensis]QGR16495.1 hypothetical protein D1869_04230 [Sulfurisphaera ohwakuensis]